MKNLNPLRKVVFIFCLAKYLHPLVKLKWHLLATNLNNFSYIWDTTKVPNTFYIQLRITANDGFGGENNDVSDYAFSIENVYIVADDDDDDDTDTGEGNLSLVSSGI